MNEQENSKLTSNQYKQDLYKLISKNVESLRIFSGKTKAVFSEEAGIDAETYGDLKDCKVISLTSLIKISEATGIYIGDLFFPGFDPANSSTSVDPSEDLKNSVHASNIRGMIYSIMNYRKDFLDMDLKEASKIIGLLNRLFSTAQEISNLPTSTQTTNKKSRKKK